MCVYVCVRVCMRRQAMYVLCTRDKHVMMFCWCLWGQSTQHVWRDALWAMYCVVAFPPLFIPFPFIYSELDMSYRQENEACRSGTVGKTGYYRPNNKECGHTTVRIMKSINQDLSARRYFTDRIRRILIQLMKPVSCSPETVGQTISLG